MSPGARVAASVVRAYQLLVSPVLPASCRFAPTCSEYACDAFREHGLAWGLWLALGRVVRCHPFHPGGFDPVPRRRT